MKTTIEKTNVLIEAMPYIQAFHGKIVVIKLGGNALEDTAACNSILTDVAFLESVGLKAVIIHGGGKAISRRMNTKGLQSTFVKGLRITDKATVKLVQEVLNDDVNPMIVKTLIEKGVRATGIQGPSILRAEKLVPKAGTGYDVNLGYVGRIVNVDTAPVTACLNANIIPVITPLGRDETGQIYNINADAAAPVIATALKAQKLVFLSDVPGILSEQGSPDSLIHTIAQEEVEVLIEKGVIAGGMIPKIRGAVSALAGGVSKVHIIDGRILHSLLLEIFTKKGIGTEIVHKQQK